MKSRRKIDGQDEVSSELKEGESELAKKRNMFKEIVEI